MRKIPTLFRRDPEDMRRVLPVVTVGCEWVLEGQGTPTRKYDGTCVMYDADAIQWFARREVKPGKVVPRGFVKIETDENTGKTVGWEPAEQSGFARWLNEAIEAEPYGWKFEPGTYELCGPKINGNPEGFTTHRLIRHADAEVLDIDARDYDGLRLVLSAFPGEGIVWHHPDGRMAKLKRRDFPHADSQEKRAGS